MLRIDVPTLYYMYTHTHTHTHTKLLSIYRTDSGVWAQLKASEQQALPTVGHVWFVFM